MLVECQRSSKQAFTWYTVRAVGKLVISALARRLENFMKGFSTTEREDVNLQYITVKAVQDEKDEDIAFCHNTAN